MARSYAPVLVSVWGDDDWRRLSVEAQRVYLLALSQPGVTYAGVVAYTAKRWARMAADTGPGDIERAVHELEAARFVIVDEETEELFIRSFVRHNGVLAQPQLRKSMQRAYGDILSPAIRKAFLTELPPDERTLLAPCAQGSRGVPEGCASPPGQEPSSSPPPITGSSSSSGGAEDEEDTRLAEACRIIAQRVLRLRIAEKGPVLNPTSWVARVASQRWSVHGERLASSSPDLTAEELADELEPDLAPARGRRVDRGCPECAGSTWVLTGAGAVPCSRCRP